jgi:hypothetical protein
MATRWALPEMAQTLLLANVGFFCSAAGLGLSELLVVVQHMSRLLAGQLREVSAQLWQ